ncbi:MAG: crossover junction endodeoxyribonuclease RuvC [Deltaproteobacteria bacterium]|nr:MAG: crossover junction endodeoxyribonuclease RuvC [Deltaproteobacteria bacterium]
MNAQRKRILGIDPGSIITGWGIVESDGNRLFHIDNGGIFTRNKEFHQRLKEIYQGIQEVVDTYRPTHVSMEQVFVSRNAQTALKLGQARGVAMIVVLNAGLSVSEYAPTAIKQAVTGTGRANKEQVTLMVQTLLGLPEPAQTDASDALAAAICHILRPKFDPGPSKTKTDNSILAQIEAATSSSSRRRRRSRRGR